MDGDRSEALCDTVRRAHAAGESLRIVGSGSKAFLTAASKGSGRPTRLLPMAGHRGIIDYRPEELVITARAGTPLQDLECALAERGQRLPFEPPQFDGAGTLGGAVACGLSGPGRPWRGAVRDAVLGVELINGAGEHLRFGGQVMKNVAGYDVSRLQVGAFGTLGLLLAVSVKVLPAPPCEQTLLFELDAATALERCRAWARQPLPITASCYWNGRLWLRLSGAEAAVAWAREELGGELASDDEGFWEALRDHRLAFFTQGGDSEAERPLWRCLLPPGATAPLADCLVTWAGGERWLRPASAEEGARLGAAVRDCGGHARPFDGGYGMRAGSHVAVPEAHYAARLKLAFDPDGLLNPELSAAVPDAD
ncbi:MAG: glycolate oxidase subunit GlcE [Pseudomonadales bacterium]